MFSSSLGRGVRLGPCFGFRCLALQGLCKGQLSLPTSEYFLAAVSSGFRTHPRQLYTKRKTPRSSIYNAALSSLCLSVPVPVMSLSPGHGVGGAGGSDSSKLLKLFETPLAKFAEYSIKRVSHPNFIYLFILGGSYEVLI